MDTEQRALAIKILQDGFPLAVDRAVVLIAAFEREVRLDEVKYWQEWYRTQDLGGWTLAFKQRIADLSAKGGNADGQ